MSRTITVQSLALLAALDRVGGSASTTELTRILWRTKLTDKDCTNGSQSQDGGIRQGLRVHSQAGRIKCDYILGPGRGGEQIRWTLTDKGRATLAEYSQSLFSLGFFKHARRATTRKSFAAKA